jgi:hypothetical protein
MRRAAVTKGSAFTDKDDDYGNPKTPQTTDLGCSLIETYIAPPDPLVNENAKDNLKFLWFDDVIEQLMNYTDKDKEHFDLVAAMIQTEIGCQSMRVTPKEPETNDNKHIVNAMFPKYSHAR